MSEIERLLSSAFIVSASDDHGRYLGDMSAKAALSEIAVMRERKIGECVAAVVALNDPDDPGWEEALVAAIDAISALRAPPLRESVNGAYRERNAVVAALAKCFPSGLAKTAIEGWDEAWHNCVYIDLPTGQASWHFHDDDATLFAGLPPYDKPWDGHSTAEKYERLAAIRKWRER